MSKEELVVAIKLKGTEGPIWQRKFKWVTNGGSLLLEDANQTVIAKIVHVSKDNYHVVTTDLIDGVVVTEGAFVSENDAKDWVEKIISGYQYITIRGEVCNSCHGTGLSVFNESLPTIKQLDCPHCLGTGIITSPPDKIDISQDSEQVAALRYSIAIWEEKLKDGCQFRFHDCPLCSLAMSRDLGSKCCKCVIASETRKFNCLGTPYHAWEEAVFLEDKDRAIVHIHEMVKFLVSLLPKDK